jgi:hypothetical protein
MGIGNRGRENRGQTPIFLEWVGQYLHSENPKNWGLSPIFVLILIMVPAAAFARVNTLSGGVSVSYDYSDRSYESVKDDPATEENEARLDDGRDDDFQSIVLTPMLHFKSLSERDSFELRTAPGISYYLDDKDTNLNNNLFIAADRFMTKSWQLGASNALIRSDYYNSDSGFSNEPADPSQEASSATDPQLSADSDRSRYWMNTFNIFSDYLYLEDSSFRMGFDYIVLRNDDTGVGGYEDYDRYVFDLRNDHRFTSVWRSTLDLQFVLGEFDPADREVVEAVIDELAPESGITPTDDQLSNDIKEYHLLLTGHNESILRNPLSLTYNYIGSKYDEILQDDSDIHQMRFTWKREFSPQVTLILESGRPMRRLKGRMQTGAGTVQLN